MRTTFLIASLLPFFSSCNTQTDTEYNRDVSVDPKSSYDDQSTNNYTNQNSDAQTTMRVKNALMNDSSLSQNARYINVDTNNGIVTLSGYVSSKEESYAIERKVKTVNGVRKVNNQLTINS